MYNNLIGIKIVGCYILPPLKNFVLEIVHTFVNEQLWIL